MDIFEKLYRPLDVETVCRKLVTKCIVDGEIRMKDTIYGEDLKITKYVAGKTMFKGKWDSITAQVARGNIINVKTGEPINMPFPKMFNMNELPGLTFADDANVIAFRKRNGFMLTFTFDENQNLIVGTTGTTDSDYAKLGASYIDEAIQMCAYELGGHHITFTVEICDPSDPHIVPEEQGIYLLGTRNNQWGSDYNIFTAHSGFDQARGAFQGTKMKMDEPIYGKFKDIKQMAKMADHEGYVVWANHRGLNMDVPLKIKSDHYLILKLFARMKAERLSALDLPKIKQKVDEEYWPLIDHVAANHVEFAKLEEQERLEKMRQYIIERNLK